MSAAGGIPPGVVGSVDDQHRQLRVLEHVVALAAEEQRRQAAAAAASRTVANGTGSAAPLVDRVDTGQPMTLRQAIEAAYDAANMQ